MDLVATLLVVAVLILSSGLLYFFTRQARLNTKLGLRPLPAFDALSNLVGRSVESGRNVHLTLGRGSLNGPAAVTSVAGLGALDKLAEDGCSSDVPPIVTVGDGTLLPASQDSVRHAYNEAGRANDYSPGNAQFIAVNTMPFTYAAGVGDVLNQNHVGSNLMIGRLGMELSLISEEAGRSGAEQVIGTDDPVGLALAFPITEHLLIGEEMLASRAYLEGGAVEIASLRVQDILRFVVAGGILLAALFHLIVGAS